MPPNKAESYFLNLTPMPFEGAATIKPAALPEDARPLGYTLDRRLATCNLQPVTCSL